MSKEIISSENAPKAIGPYSQAVKVGDKIFTSGQIPIDPKTGEVVTGGIEDQTRQVIENIKAVLKEAGAELSNIVKNTVYVKDMNDFAAVNEIYGEYFESPYPARSFIEVARLPRDVKIEIESIVSL